VTVMLAIIREAAALRRKAAHEIDVLVVVRLKLAPQKSTSAPWRTSDRVAKAPDPHGRARGRTKEE
jgi:hypothetical protein